MWFEESSLRVLLDLHFPEWDKSILSKFNAQDLVDKLVNAKVDTSMFYAKCHNGNAYYNTKSGHKHKCIGKRDIFGECVQEARRKGLNVVGYYSVVWDKYIARTYPEWVMRDSQGNICDDPLFWAYICYTNDGYKEYVKAQLKELVDNYDIDGLWLDMLIFDSLMLTCYCKNCKRLFKDKTGKDIPVIPTWDKTWREFLEFRYEMLQSYAEDIIRYVKKIAPNISVIFNYQGGPNFSWKTGHRPVQHTVFNDYGTIEVYPSWYGISFASLGSKFARGLVKNRHFETLNTIFTGGWNYAVKTEEQLRWEVMTCLVNGAGFTLVDQPFHDGSISPVVYRRLGKVYSEAKRKKEYFGGEFLREVGIYYSVKSRDWYAKDKVGKYLLEFNGIYQILLESHIQTDILFDENIGKDNLSEYPVLILAEVAILSPEEVEKITEYVEKGGILIATHDTGLFDEWGRGKKEFDLKHLYGITFAGKTETEHNYVRIDEKKFDFGIDKDYYLLCTGHGNVIKVGKKALSVGKLHISFYDRRPNRFFSHNIHPPYKEVGPAAVINKYGKGKVVYIPYRLGASYAWEHKIPEHRIFLQNIIRMLEPQPVISVEAPLNVEAVITRQENKKRWIVHLVACNPTLPASTPEAEMGKRISPFLTIEEPFEYRAVINIKAPYSNIRAFDKTTRLSAKGRKAEVMTNKTHEVVIIEE